MEHVTKNAVILSHTEINFKILYCKLWQESNVCKLSTLHGLQQSENVILSATKQECSETVSTAVQKLNW